MTVKISLLYIPLRRSVLVRLFFYIFHLFKRLCVKGANVCVTPAGQPSIFFYVITYCFSFLKLGSEILVHHGRLPYPRLKLFLFPLTSFRLLIFMYYFKDDLKKALRVCTV